MATPFTSAGPFTSSNGLTRTSNLPDTQAFTFCAWVYWPGSGGGSTIRSIFSLNNGVASMGLYVDASGNLIMSWPVSATGNNTLTLVSSGSFTAGWWFVGISCGGSSAGTVWAYASKLGQGSITNVDSNASNAAITESAMALSYPDATAYWPGRIFNAKIWGAQLTDAQIALEQFAYRPQRTTNLNGWYPLEDNANEAYGTGYNWTTSGSISYSNEGPTAVFYVNKAASNAWPTGTVDGDLVIASLWNNGPSFGVPAGWTEIGSGIAYSTTYYHRHVYKVYGTGDSFPSTPTFATNVWSFRGANQTTPFRSGQLATGETTSGTVSLTSVTAGENGECAVYGCAGFSTGTHTNPANYTERFDPAGGDTSGGDRLGLTASQSTSGSITRTSGQNCHWFHGILTPVRVAVIGADWSADVDNSAVYEDDGSEYVGGQGPPTNNFARFAAKFLFNGTGYNGGDSIPAGATILKVEAYLNRFSSDGSGWHSTDIGAYDTDGLTDCESDAGSRATFQSRCNVNSWGDYGSFTEWNSSTGGFWVTLGGDAVADVQAALDAGNFISLAYQDSSESTLPSGGGAKLFREYTDAPDNPAIRVTYSVAGSQDVTAGTIASTATLYAPTVAFIVRVQEQKSSNSSSSTWWSVTLPNSVKAGSLIVVVVSRYTDGDGDLVVGDCTPSGSASFGAATLDEQHQFANQECCVFSIPVTADGTATITIDSGSSSTDMWWTLAAAEYKGVDVSASRVNGVNSADYNGGTSVSTGNAATGGPGLFVGGFNAGASFTIDTTPSGAGWVEVIEETDGANVMVMAMSERIVLSDTTDDAAWTWSTATLGSCCVVAYKQNTGTGPGDQDVTAGTIASGATLYAPTVVPERLVVGGTIATTAALYAPLLSYSGYSWGEQFPTAEDPNSWSLWQTAPATPIFVSGDSDWGKAVVFDGIPIYGPVVDLADADTKKIQATIDKYGAGNGAVDVYIRGSATSFAQHDGTPTWSLYAGTVEQAWRYVQLRIQVS